MKNGCRICLDSIAKFLLMASTVFSGCSDLNTPILLSDPPRSNWTNGPSTINVPSVNNEPSATKGPSATNEPRATAGPSATPNATPSTPLTSPIPTGTQSVLSVGVDLTPSFYISVQPGKITLTSHSSSLIRFPQFLLSFHVQEPNGVGSLWGSPWLNWQPTVNSSAATQDYEFNSTSPLYADIQSGDKITIEYSPAYQSAALPADIKLLGLDSSSATPTPTSTGVAPGSGSSPTTIPGTVSTPTTTPTPTPTTVPTSAVSSVPVSVGGPLPDPLYVGYFQTWSENWASAGSRTSLAKLAPYVNVAILAFMAPDAVYSGGLNLSGTGVSYSSEGLILKDSIALLKSNHPGTKVLIAIGGATYQNWPHFNAQAIASFVRDFGLDGVDIDYEVDGAGCYAPSRGAVSCATDANLISVVTRLRSALPPPYLLSIAAWSVGAYGVGSYVSSSPSGLDHTGMEVNLLKSSSGQSLDLINIMSYDAGSTLAPANNPTGFVPTEALSAYRSLFPSGKIALGVEVPQEAWGSHELTLSEIDSEVSFVRNHGGNGMMIWSLQKPFSGTGSRVDAQTVSQRICFGLGLNQCSLPLFSQ